MIVQSVRLKSNLPEDELLKRAHERKPQFEAMPGLIQKYYMNLPEEGEYMGFYIWDSMESLLAFRETDLAKSIPAAYEVVEPPKIEVSQMMFQLRD